MSAVSRFAEASGRDCAEAEPPVSFTSRVDESFFDAYGWCLNPLQTFTALCGRAREELARHDATLVTWQREEVRTNLYLLLSAACCTIDDYLAHRPCDTSPVARRLPRLGRPLRVGESGVNAAVALAQSASLGRVRRFREKLARSLDLACAILVEGGDGRPGTWANLRAAVGDLSGTGLPERLLAWRSRIPEAFRCQDMSHHDPIALAEAALDSGACGGGPVLVVGLRTAGAYFAPLVAAFLAARSVSVTKWVTIRPKVGLSRDEHASLLRAVPRTARVFVIDDHPNTGGTFSEALNLFARLGFASERFVVLAPEHPAQLDWRRVLDGVRVIALPFERLHTRRLLRDNARIAAILRECFRAQGWREAILQDCPEVERLNETLSSHSGDSFEVRSKRVYRVQLRADGGSVAQRHILAKSVGCGWLGYHAALAGLRLREFVPAFVGFRQGLLFSEWLGPLDTSPKHPALAEVADLVPRYVSARVARLRLQEDPSFAGLGVRRAGWDTLVRLLGQPYGRLLGPAFAGRLRAELVAYVAPKPVLVDGRMGLGEWISAGDRIAKTDFEHHNFGGAQQDVVDPCYDLACALRELDVSEAAEQAMLATYAAYSGDASASLRLPLYKLLSGVVAMQTAAYCILRAPSRGKQEAWNRSYSRARDFLNFALARHSVSSLGYRPPPPQWSSRLFFLDLDGVFDAELFSPLFQHTTPSALAALSLLQAAGHSVVLNTGRSVEHVKRYCQIYGLPAGVAEYGSVFFDAVAQTELPLVDEQAQEELRRCRSCLESMPGVFVDPGYRWSLRAYRFRAELTTGLDAEELEQLVGRFDRLAFIAREADSHIVQKGVDKGSATAFVRNRLPRCERPVIAIGDSALDLAMFDQVDIAYVPANFAPAYARTLCGAKYRRLRNPRQMGLLEAARNLTGTAAFADAGVSELASDRDLIARLLRIAEQPKWRRILGIVTARHVHPPTEYRV